MSKEPPLDLRDELLAGILHAGVVNRVVERSSVVAWADAEILRRAEPPTWLLDLSVSQRLSETDLASLLYHVAVPEFREGSAAVCRGLYSLLPHPLPNQNYEYLQVLAEHLYRIALNVLNPHNDYCPKVDYALWREADRVRDNFTWEREGYGGLTFGSKTVVPLTRDEVAREFLDFVERQYDDQVRPRLAPVEFVLPAAARID